MTVAVKLASAQAAMELKQPDPPRKRRADRQFKRRPIAEITSAASALGFGSNVFGFVETLGYSRNAWYGWEASGEAPECAVLLAEARVAAAEAAASSAPDRLAEDEVVMLVRVKGQANRTMLATLAKGLGLEWVVV